MQTDILIFYDDSKTTSVADTKPVTKALDEIYIKISSYCALHDLSVS